MTTLTLFEERPPSGGYDAPLDDETLTSWVARHPWVGLKSDDAEREFGVLDIRLPKASVLLRRRLAQSARPPAAWVLPRGHRWQSCPRCVAEDWVRGLPSHERRQWLVAWRTTCPRHGPLRSRKYGELTWVQVVRWPDSGPSTLSARDGLKGPVSFSIGRERRAIYLEGILAGSPLGWQPKGLRKGRLQVLYEELLHALAPSFIGATRADWDPCSAFQTAPCETRHLINTLIEAILAVETRSPLPSPINAFRTQALVRAVGWSADAVRRHPDDILIESVHCAVSGLGTVRSRWLEAVHAKVGSRGSGDVALLSVNEARVLGIDTSGLDGLFELTRVGRLGRLDRRRGRLHQVANPVPLSKYECAALRRMPLSLPKWATGGDDANARFGLPRAWEIGPVGY